MMGETNGGAAFAQCAEPLGIRRVIDQYDSLFDMAGAQVFQERIDGTANQAGRIRRIHPNPDTIRIFALVLAPRINECGPVFSQNPGSANRLISFFGRERIEINAVHHSTGGFDIRNWGIPRIRIAVGKSSAGLAANIAEPVNISGQHDRLLVRLESAESLATARAADDAGVANRELGTRPALTDCPASPTMEEGQRTKKAPMDGACAPSFRLLRRVAASTATGKS